MSSAACPAWCASHSVEVTDRTQGRVTTHCSRRLDWSDETPDTYVQIERTDRYGDDTGPAGIFISHGEARLDGLHEITATEARRLGAALATLADALELG